MTAQTAPGTPEEVRDKLMRRVMLAQINAERLTLVASTARLSKAVDALLAAEEQENRKDSS